MQKENKQIIKRIATSAIKGYLFGGLVGMFISPTQKFKCTFKTMHRTGITFMSINAAYTTTDELLSRFDKTNDKGKNASDFNPGNQVLASCVAGGIGMAKGGFKKSVFGATSFTLYNAICSFFQDS